MNGRGSVAGLRPLTDITGTDPVERTWFSSALNRERYTMPDNAYRHPDLRRSSFARSLWQSWHRLSLNLWANRQINVMVSLSELTITKSVRDTTTAYERIYSLDRSSIAKWNIKKPLGLLERLKVSLVRPLSMQPAQEWPRSDRPSSHSNMVRICSSPVWCHGAVANGLQKWFLGYVTWLVQGGIQARSQREFIQKSKILIWKYVKRNSGPLAAVKYQVGLPIWNIRPETSSEECSEATTFPQ